MEQELETHMQVHTGRILQAGQQPVDKVCKAFSEADSSPLTSLLLPPANVSSSSSLCPHSILSEQSDVERGEGGLGGVKDRVEGGESHADCCLELFFHAEGCTCVFAGGVDACNDRSNFKLHGCKKPWSPALYRQAGTTAQT